MKALVIRPGNSPELVFEPDYPDPSPPAGDVLVRVRLAGICATDLEIARGYMKFSGVPGHEFVGTVVAGPNHLVGQRVVADINCACHQCDLCARGWPGHCRRRTVLGIAGRDGAFAEQLVVPAGNCHIVPPDLPDEQAVFAEPLAAALQVTELEPMARGSRVVVLGSGRLGLLVAQVLSLRDCQVEVVGRNDKTLSLCRSWGLRATEVAALAPQTEHDVVVECTGSPDGLSLALRMCRPRGTIVLKSTYTPWPTVDLAPVVIHELRVVGNRCGPMGAALRLLLQRQVRTRELISAVHSLDDGKAAFAAAADPRCIKVLLRPGNDGCTS